MTIALRPRGSAVVLDVGSQLTIGRTCEELDSLAERLLLLGLSDQILNLERTKKVDAAGIGELIRLRNRFEDAGGHLLLAGVQRPPKVLLELARVLPFFQVFDSDQEAAASLRRSRVESPGLHSLGQSVVL